MDFRVTYNKPKGQAAFTLIEVMVASAIALLAAAAVASFTYTSSLGYARMTNYTDLGQSTQLTLDKMSREIRQAHSVLSYSANSITLQDIDGNPLQYTYDSTSRSLVRKTKLTTDTYLTDCDSLQFFIYQHTAISNSFDCYAPTYLKDARVVLVRWTCSRPMLGGADTTDKMHSDKITLRNR